jgi:hypothetical protein
LWRLGIVADVVGLVLSVVGLQQPSDGLLHLALMPFDAFGLAVAIMAWLGSRYGRGPVGKWVSIGGVWMTTLECVAGLVGYVVQINTIPVAQPTPEQSTISYYAGGNAPSVTVQFRSNLATIEDESSTTQQVTLPWHSAVMLGKGSGIGDFSVTAPLDGGTVNCTVTVDGKVVKTASATGADATADCGSDPTVP